MKFEMRPRVEVVKAPIINSGEVESALMAPGKKPHEKDREKKIQKNYGWIETIGDMEKKKKAMEWNVSLVTVV